MFLSQEISLERKKITTTVPAISALIDELSRHLIHDLGLGELGKASQEKYLKRQIRAREVTMGEGQRKSISERAAGTSVQP